MIDLINRIIFAAAVVFAGVLALLSFLPQWEIAISERQIRDALKAELPIKSDSFLIESITLELTEDSQGGLVHVVLDGSVSVSDISARTHADTVSRVTYRDGSFFLDDLNLDDLDFYFDNKSMEHLQNLKGSAGLFWNWFVEENENAGEEYKEDPDRFVELYQELVHPKFLKFVQENLGKVPIYRFSDQKLSLIAWLALERIVVESEQVIAVVSPRRMASKLFPNLIILIVIPFMIRWLRERTVEIYQDQDS